MQQSFPEKLRKKEFARSSQRCQGRKYSLQKNFPEFIELAKPW